MVKKLCAVVLGMAMAISAGCAAVPNPDGGETPGGNETQTEVNLENYKKARALEEDYVYMWNRDGLRGEECVVNFQTAAYAMQVDGKLGKLVAVQILVTKEIEDEHFGGASLEIVLTLAHGDHSLYLKF